MLNKFQTDVMCFSNALTANPSCQLHLSTSCGNMKTKSPNKIRLYRRVCSRRANSSTMLNTSPSSLFLLIKNSGCRLMQILDTITIIHTIVVFKSEAQHTLSSKVLEMPIYAIQHCLSYIYSNTST